MTALPRGLYGMVDAERGEPEQAIIDRALFLVDLGVQAVQVRAKHHISDSVLSLAARLVDRVPLLIINDHSHVAFTLGGGTGRVWAHVGQDDDAHPNVPFGRSTHTVEQVLACGAATYVGFGPVFETRSKDTGYSARGLERLAEAVRVSPVPVVAIGGISVENVDAVRECGVHAWAPIRGLWDRQQDGPALRRLLEH